MKLSELDPVFMQRLENWGAYYRDSRRAAQSMTAKICKRAAQASGDRMGSARAVSPRPQIDAQDAQQLEWCWAMCGHRVSAKDRALVKAHFVDRADPRMVCRLLQVRWLSWEGDLCAAVMRFSDAVVLLESTHYNPSQQTRQPSMDVR